LKIQKKMLTFSGRCLRGYVNLNLPLSILLLSICLMKRHLSFIEFGLPIQFFIVGINTVLLIPFLYFFLSSPDDIPLFFLVCVHFLLGFYQFVLSAIPNMIWLATRKDIDPSENHIIFYRVIHFSVSVLILLGFVEKTDGGFGLFVNIQEFFLGVGFVITQILAYFYAWITWKHCKILKQIEK
jgi:hypothetical protein